MAITWRNKILLFLVTVFTFGFFWLWFWHHNKKDVCHVATSLSVSKKLPFALPKLLSAVGSNNISAVEATHTRVKITFVDPSKVQVAKIRVLPQVKGSFLTSTSLTLVVGNAATTLAQALSTHVVKKRVVAQNQKL